MEKKKEVKKKLNIAIVCDPILECTGGSFIATWRFAELLHKKGHKVIFIAARSPKNLVDNEYKGIKIYRFRSLLLPKTEGQFYIAFPTISRLKKILKQEEIDVLHAAIPTPAAVASIKAAKALGVKIVAHSHTQPENILLNLPRILARQRIYKSFYTLLSWIYHHADALVYPTEFARKLLNRLNGDIKNVVISNGVDMSIFKKTDTKEFFEKFNLSHKDKYILFVGRLHPEKCVDVLIKSVPAVIKKQPHTRILIGGFGYLDVALKKLAKKLGIEKEVIFLGKVSDEDLVLAYNTCDVFVLPSLAELEGMVVLEVMACGKPIIIADSKDSASPYFVDNNGFLFKPGDSEDLAEKVLKILSDDKLRHKMGEMSLQKSKQYDINQSVASLEDLYYSIL